MRLFFVSLLVVYSPFNIAAVDSATDAFFKTTGNENKVIRSINSNYCHPAQSSVRNQVKLQANNSNVYDTLDGCRADGGEIPPSILESIVAEDPVAKEEEQKKVEKKELQDSYAGFNWGAGLMFANYSERVVQEATINNGVVSVDHEVRTKAVAMLESHYFFVPGDKKVFGFGPFVGIGLVGDDGVDPLSMFGGGVMVGFRKDNSAASWNVGLGYFVDTNAKTLRKGLEDGSATTETDSAKLFKKQDIGGVMLMFSSSF